MNTVLLEESAEKLRHALHDTPLSCALMLGSGWADATASLGVKQTIGYAEIPCLGSTQIQGHPGQVVVAEHAGIHVLIFQGRRHWYEGAGWEPIAFPIYVCRRMRIPVIILTNAAGGVRDSLEPGDLMIVDDHINAMGVNPLIGGHDPVWGPRFPDQTNVYDAELRRLLDRAAAKMGSTLPHGTYAAVSGPTYETPAEVEVFRRMGASAIGMSTVPEAILAHAAGMRVAAISCITNQAASRSEETVITHEEALVQAVRCQPQMRALLLHLLADPAFHALCHEERR
jgi:purine-nucleoside phosphorylase